MLHRAQVSANLDLLKTTIPTWSWTYSSEPGRSGTAQIQEETELLKNNLETKHFWILQYTADIQEELLRYYKHDILNLQ